MKKDFDCVEMKRKGQDLLRARLANMSAEERTAYWTKRNQELRERVERAREHGRKKSA